MEIVEVMKPKENKLISKFDFESNNSLNDEDEEERNFIIE